MFPTKNFLVFTSYKILTLYFIDKLSLLNNQVVSRKGVPKGIVTSYAYLQQNKLPIIPNKKR